MLNNIQEEVLHGLMLGDGNLSIHKNGKNPSLYVKRSIKDLSYLEYHAKIYENFLTNIGIRIGYSFDKRTSKNYQFCSFRTQCLSILDKYYKMWYPNNIKIIPPTLNLTPRIIATWLADDGSIMASNKHPETLTLKFATDGFTKEDTLMIKTKLEKRYNFEFKMYKHTKNQYIIMSTISENTKKILIDIDSYFPLGMERKSIIWRREEAKLFHFTPIILCPTCKICKSSNVRRRGKYPYNDKKWKFSCNDCGKNFISTAEDV